MILSMVNAETSEQNRSVRFAVPSDSVNGNFLEAINTTLNLLDKHYMDRYYTPAIYYYPCDHCSIKL